MGRKLGKSEFPSGHGPNDFQCFGPAATKDGEFEGTLICDMGCFKQDGTDSNKYYHGAVVQSKLNQRWGTYFEWGRTGAKNPQFQFVDCDSKADAEAEYADQLHDKNDKRGVWVQHPALGRILQAKPTKDCYLVRPQATRATGLPDARTIKVNEGTKTTKTVTVTATKKKAPTCDAQTLKLMRDINVATVAFTRGAMTDDSLPTQSAIDEARDILSAAMSRVKIVGDNVDNQVADRELKDLTSLIYGRIPKKKDRGAAAATWILSGNNIVFWQQDLNAFESALNTVSSDALEDEADPFGGMRLKMEWLPPTSKSGEFIHHWLPQATRNRHSYLGAMKVKNVWLVDREGDGQRLAGAQQRIGKVVAKERPFHQPSARHDLDATQAKIFADTHTTMLIHGTRSVNVRGILDKALMLPKQLVGVTITGAMFGPGLYFADDWKKSAGYTSLSGGYYSSGSGGIKGRGAFMFVADVALGLPYLAPSSGGYTSPPKQDGKTAHCVFGKAGHSGVQNNEWIVFNTDQNRLRYLVEFDVA
jgi:predicted DNA-binding WGR domain protein